MIISHSLISTITLGQTLKKDVTPIIQKKSHGNIHICSFTSKLYTVVMICYFLVIFVFVFRYVCLSKGILDAKVKALKHGLQHGTEFIDSCVSHIDV